MLRLANVLQKLLLICPLSSGNHWRRKCPEKIIAEPSASTNRKKDSKFRREKGDSAGPSMRIDKGKGTMKPLR